MARLPASSARSRHPPTANAARKSPAASSPHSQYTALGMGTDCQPKTPTAWRADSGARSTATARPWPRRPHRTGVRSDRLCVQSTVAASPVTVTATAAAPGGPAARTRPSTARPPIRPIPIVIAKATHRGASGRLSAVVVRTAPATNHIRAVGCSARDRRSTAAMDAMAPVTSAPLVPACELRKSTIGVTATAKPASSTGRWLRIRSARLSPGRVPSGGCPLSRSHSPAPSNPTEMRAEPRRARM